MAVSARSAILADIRSNNALRSATPREDAWPAIARDYSRTGELDQFALLTLFRQRLEDYGAGVRVIASASSIAEAVREQLDQRSLTRVLTPPDFPPNLLPTGIRFYPDAAFTSAELDTFNGVVTQSTLAIAETGTIVLQHAPGQGRRAVSLVPDYHLCLVQASDIVQSVPEAIARLAPTARLPTSFISGPSATSDIEMTRIKGVHGPRSLDVLIVLQVDPDEF